MTSRHGAPPPQASKLATIGVCLAVAALIFSFWAQPLAVLLLLAAIVIGAIALVRTRGGRPGKAPAYGAIVVSLVALIVVGATSPTPPQPVPVAAPAPAPSPVIDPNVLPADVVVASVQSPDNLVTTAGRRLHVTMMQGHPAADACQTGTNAATATRLVQNQRVHIAAPDATRSDTPTAVPPGFQPVVLTLPDGTDYAQTWAQTAAENWQSECVTTEPTPTSEVPPPTTTTSNTDVDIDRPYVPAPDRHVNTKIHTGHSGHPCLPGERDGDHDGYCGE